jgi:exodeoxyribonuclease VII small subunit
MKVTEKTPTFETILNNLEKIVNQMESGELALEKSIALFEEGVKLTRIGESILENAQQRVDQLLKNGTSTKPFEEK